MQIVIALLKILSKFIDLILPTDLPALPSSQTVLRDDPVLAPGEKAGERKDGVQNSIQSPEKPDAKDIACAPPIEIPFQPHSARPRAELIFSPRTPTVYLTPEAYKRMCLYVELAPLEVGWLGTISKLDKGDLLIEEVFLVEQEVMAAETELSVVGIEKLMMELIGKGEAGLEKANKLHFWGHSHVRMPTNPSFTDENTMRRFANEGHEVYVRGIFNKLGKANFDVYYCREGFRLLDVPWAVLDTKDGKILLKPPHPESWSDKLFKDRPKQNEDRLPIDESLRAQVKTEYDLKVKEKWGAIGLVDWLFNDKSKTLPSQESKKSNEPS